MQKDNVYYIKLGSGSRIDIAEKCIANNLLWLGYNEATEDVIQKAIRNEQQNPSKDWKETGEDVRQSYSNANKTTQTK